MLAQDVRPGDERPELPQFGDRTKAQRSTVLALPPVPDFMPPERQAGTVLPQVVLPGTPDTQGLAGGASALVREIRVLGNTAIPTEDLAPVARPYLERELSFGDIAELRDALTLAYVERGYVTSGAVVPQQSLADGILEVWIIEGRITDVQIQNEGRLRDSYVRRRIERSLAVPLNVNDLQHGLQVLQKDPRIASIHASLVPGERRGEAVLRMRVLEARPWQIRLAGNNYNAPSLGEGRGQILLAHQNLTGVGDALSAEYKYGTGLHDVRANWDVPVTAFDTSFGLHMRRTWSEVVSAPFDVLDITSETQTYGFSLRQPLYRSETSRLEAFLIGEWRKSESYLLGEPFSFVIGPINGVGQETVLRFGGSYSYGSREQALSLRSMFSFGLAVLRATQNAEGVPDGQYFAWLGQAQYARRFEALWGTQLVARADVQLADRPLLGLEQFAMGGHATVRGYRENQLVRDNGVVGSLELRIPVLLPSWREWRPSFEIVPFYDVGYSWNADRPEFGEKLLMSVGIGGRLGLSENLEFQAYWGYDIENIASVGDGGLQDDGVHIGVIWEIP